MSTQADKLVERKGPSENTVREIGRLDFMGGLCSARRKRRKPFRKKQKCVTPVSVVVPVHRPEVVSQKLKSIKTLRSVTKYKEFDEEEPIRIQKNPSAKVNVEKDSEIDSDEQELQDKEVKTKYEESLVFVEDIVDEHVESKEQLRKKSNLRIKLKDSRTKRKLFKIDKRERRLSRQLQDLIPSVMELINEKGWFGAR